MGIDMQVTLVEPDWNYLVGGKDWKEYMKEQYFKKTIIESGLVGLVGVILGVVFGVFVSGILTWSGIGIIPLLHFDGGTFNTIVAPEFMLGALLFSMVVGILSSILPARMASNLQPVEALRYE